MCTIECKFGRGRTRAERRRRRSRSRSVAVCKPDSHVARFEAGGRSSAADNRVTHGGPNSDEGGPGRSEGGGEAVAEAQQCEDQTAEKTGLGRGAPGLRASS